jgi:peptide-methionine (R)-S-oxide reductase
MNRRKLLHSLTILPLALAMKSGLAAARTRDDITRMQDRWSEFLPQTYTPPAAAPAVSYTEEEWRRRLTPAAFDVLRQEGTERPFTSALNDEKRAGVFVCAGCDLPLFTSEMKYDSGTGWPSFFTHIPDHMGTKRDFKLILPRTEYHCIRCGGHQGHVFKDGPAPTNERWCNNGLALKFVPSSDS